ncbi:uncharacterized protein [Asterias amurensis]|uniref:uncharacterized protein isoform X1 n=1 Tax=Asterias amurensis TaxID=7602 RepID=UPI003AB50A94
MMYPHVSLAQRLSAVISVLVLLWSSQCWAQQVIAKCWLFSPDVDEASINVEMSTVNRGDRSDAATGGQLWSVSAKVTWARPPTLGVDGAYAVSVVRMPSFQPPKLCQIETTETVVTPEEFVFNGLDFGFLYEFRIFVVNRTALSKSLVVVAKGFGTSDCFQATGDKEFCRTAEVQFAGSPIEPRLDALCRKQANSSTIKAQVSWEPPIQIQGFVTAYKMQYSQADAPAGTLPEVTTAMPDISEGGRVHSELFDLATGTSYTLLISAFVVQDGGFNEGLEVELNFQTTGALTSFSICMDLPTTLAPPTPPKKVTPKPPPVKQPTTPSPGNLNIINATVMTEDVLTGTMAEQPTSNTETTRLPDVTTRSTTKDHVGEKAVSSSKTAGIAVAACLVSIGIICAAVLFVLHLLKERTTKEAAIRPDTKGAQKGTKTTTSPA